MNKFSQQCLNGSVLIGLLVAFAATIFSANGQNQVANPSFETCTFLNPPGFTFCPDDVSQMWKASGWNESWLPVPYDANMENWTYGSPDYSRIGDFLANLYDSRTPHSGNGFAGAFQFSTSVPNMREYIVNKLGTPLIAGQQYSVSFWAIMPNPEFARFSIDKMGVYFSVAAPPCTNTSAPCNASSALMSVTPQVTTPGGVFPNGNWQQFSMSFTASAAYQYMTFGNFSSDALTTYSTVYPAAFSDLSYIVVDDFDVHPINPLPVSMISCYSECKNNNTSIIWATYSEVNCAGFIIEKSNCGNIWEHVDFMAGAGNSNTPQQYQYTVGDEEGDGTYYRLIQVDFDGESIELPAIFVSCGNSTIDVKVLNHSMMISGIENPTLVKIVDLNGNTLFEGTISNNHGYIPIPKSVSVAAVVIGNEVRSQIVKKIFLNEN